MLMILQEGAQAGATQQDIQIAQETVIAIIGASTIVVLGLLLLMAYFAKKAPTKEGPLHYGNFFVVIFGIMTVLIGFLIAFPLVVSRVFTDPTQVIALLSALFGTIVGLVGTYFGVKSSSDAGQTAQRTIAERVALESNGLTHGSTNGPLSGATAETSNGASTEGASREPAVARSRMDTGETGTQDPQPGRDPSPTEEGERNR